MTPRVHVEWGPSAPVAGFDAVVVVDVLSFTTTVTVAADRGTAVIPCPAHDEGAERLARAHDAVLARPRSAAGPGQVSLSPVSVRAAAAMARLVLPSPNGSTITAALAVRAPTLLAGALRNRSALARELRRRGAGSVLVIAAGERWPDGGLRPAVEDLWGAGAVVAALGGDPSPEAGAAAAAFAAVVTDIPAVLADSVGGRELAGLGHPGDVAIAAELDASDAVPVLRDGAYRPA